MAPLAPPADREAADYLGVQDPIPGCSVPVGCGQDHFCGRRPGKAEVSNSFSPRVTSSGGHKSANCGSKFLLRALGVLLIS